MIKDLRNTFKQTAIYGLSNLFVKAAGLILIPIYTSTLSVSDYGMLAMFEMITQFFVGVVSFSLPAAMLRLGSDTENTKTQNQIYFTANVLLLGFTAAFLILAFPFKTWFSQVIFDSSAFGSYFTIAFISIALEMFGMMPMQLLRLREKSVQYLLFFALKLVSMVSFVWYFVAVKDMGVYGALLGILLANVALIIGTLPIQFKNLEIKFEKKAARELYAFGAPLIAMTAAATILNIADRVIIERFGSLTDLGVYTLAYKIGSLSNLLIIGTFALGFLPIAFKKFGDENFNPFFSKMFTYFMGLCIVLTLVISLFGKEGIKILSSENPDYWIAIILVPFIAFVFLFKALQTYLSYVFFLIKRTKYHAYVTVFGLVINLALNLSLIPFFGMYGAIAATGLSYVFMSIYTYKLAKTKYPVNYEFRRIFILLISCAVFIATGIAFNELGLIARISIKSTLIAGYGVFLYYAVADATERDRIQKGIHLLKSGNFKDILSLFS